MQALHLSSKFRFRLTSAFLFKATVALSFTAVLASPGDAVGRAARGSVGPPFASQPTTPSTVPRRRARRETRATAAIHFERPESALELVSDLHQLDAGARAQRHVGRGRALAHAQ